MIVWYDVGRSNSDPYVPRCSRCGRFPERLLKHWFFTGLYCYSCVQDKFYHNVFTVAEINAAGEAFELYDNSKIKEF